MVGDESSAGYRPDIGRNDGQIPTNGLVLDTDLVTTLTPAPLGVAIGAGSFAVNPAAAPGFIDLESGRAILKYIATCALSSEQELVVGDQHLPGFYGLAPQWTTEACDASCQHWVIGCLLAHTNQRGESVHISLRGDHPGLATTPELVAQYGLEEAAFYGEFGTDPSGRAQLFGCMGETATSDSARRVITGRVCGIGECGVQLSGFCYDWSSNAPNITTACAQRRGTGGYVDCRDRLGSSGTVTHETVTVYTAP